MSIKFSQSPKAVLPIEVTESGISILAKPHCFNANSPIVFNELGSFNYFRL